MKERIKWIDQVKGFAIFLVVYGHNFPVYEKYIYSFHMPLFFMLSGVFHKESFSMINLKNKIRQLLMPYLGWSILLYMFWFILGRNFGVSAEMNYSPIKNLFGVFYAQGGHEYMDWGIPLWFLPALFMTFIFMSALTIIKNKLFFLLAVLFASLLGVILPYYVKGSFFWSIHVALVSLVFYAFGFCFKDKILKLKVNKYKVLLWVFGVLHIFLFQLSGKVDMYRSEYGNVFLFFVSGISGSVFYLLIFRFIVDLKFFEILGKYTIVILALQLRAMTVIKFVLLIIFGVAVFNFSEFEKFVYVIVQIMLILPIAIFIQKKLSFLNGGNKSK